MSKYACLTKNSERAISAGEAFYRYGKTCVYYCPNRKCRAKMVLCSRNGEKHHYFRALKNAHCTGCFVKNSPGEKKERQLYLGEQFSLTSFLQSMLNENYSSNDRGYTKKQKFPVSKEKIKAESKVKTINDLYHYCIKHNSSNSAGDTAIRGLLLDEQSSFSDENSLSGIHLVKCEFHRYDKGNKLLYFKITDNISIQIYINDIDLYSKIKQICFIAKNNNSKLLVFGNLKNRKMILYSIKQIKKIK